MLLNLQKITKSHIAAFAVAMTALLGTTTGCKPDPVEPDPTDSGIISNTCQANAECGAGFICQGGTCVPGECVPELQSQCGTDADPAIEPYCCQPWQLCSDLYTCVANPDSPIGTQCVVSEDCPGIGQFCSGGTCYDPAGRSSCTASFQCGGDERCDLTIFLCVPDNGGCNFCDQLPELCCENGFLCDQESSFCVEVSGAECTVDTVAQDCRPNQKCDSLGRCVQCIEDTDCGPGTQCNVGTGTCFSVLNQCESDADCSAGRRCIVSLNECIAPQCERDADCDDNRESCDLTTFTCFLPPATCNERDEPNNDLPSASAMGAASYSSTLCRGDADLVSFPIAPSRRYRVTVGFSDFTTEGIQLALIDANGVELDSEQLGFFEDEITLVGISPEDATGNFYVRLQGTGTEEDQWAYTITVEDSAAPAPVNCAEETQLGIEPNNNFATAHDLTAGSYTFGRCGDNDVDFYRIVVGELNSVRISVDFADDQGDLNATLFSAANNNAQVDSSTTTTNIERVDAPEGRTEYWLKIERFNDFFSEFDTNQSYTVIIEELPRPAECATDPHEPDTSIVQASTLPLDIPHEALICSGADVDFYRVVVPANQGGLLSLAFTHSQGDLRLELLDPDGTIVASSNQSNAQFNGEVVDLPFAAEEKTYFARVRLNAGAAAGQTYTLEASVYDASQCVLSEPVDNNALSSGQCLGAFTTTIPCVGPILPNVLVAPSLQTCTDTTSFVPGCGTTCGVADEDWYRVGTVNGQLIRARLEHASRDGILGLALVRTTGTGGQITVAENNNVAADDSLELNLLVAAVNPVFAREYAVVVRPVGTTGYTAQAYSLSVEVSAPCVADSLEPNNQPNQSTLLRQNAAPNASFTTSIDGSLCGADVDVFELIAFPGEQITARLVGATGLTVDIGQRPADLSKEAVLIPGGAGSVVSSNAGEDAVVVANTANDRTQQIYFTVKSADGIAVGDYTLQVEITSP